MGVMREFNRDSLGFIERAQREYGDFLLMRLTLEIVVRCLFSADVSHDVDEVGATLGELVKPFAAQATLKWILNNRLPTPYHIHFHRLAKKIDDVVYRIIAERHASGTDA